MKILILSDIHANWYALEAILGKESHDVLIFLGDVVDFGPNPSDCIRFLMNSSSGRFWGVRGDHDHAVAYGMSCRCSKELRKLAVVTREWGEGFIKSEEIGFLRRLPLDNCFTLGGLTFHLAHGSYGDSIHGDVGYDDIGGEFEVKNGLAGINTDYVLVGHSHRPFIKRLGRTTVLNPGSVGQPMDFNPRASYAVIEDGEATIKRVRYDIERTVKDLEKSSLPRDVVGELVSILVIGGVVKDNDLSWGLA
ncbi:MAG TPA: metallophosphoesterase family protein [Thermodesulfobacteriota bacterium]|nr:metallophosphoesterase family protein [Thermodesulfobacteriota bacterium]